MAKRNKQTLRERAEEAKRLIDSELDKGTDPDEVVNQWYPVTFEDSRIRIEESNVSDLWKLRINIYARAINNSHYDTIMARVIREDQYIAKINGEGVVKCENEWVIPTGYLTAFISLQTLVRITPTTAISTLIIPLIEEKFPTAIANIVLEYSHFFNEIDNITVEEISELIEPYVLKEQQRILEEQQRTEEAIAEMPTLCWMVDHYIHEKQQQRAIEEVKAKMEMKAIARIPVSHSFSELVVDDGEQKFTPNRTLNVKLLNSTLEKYQALLDSSGMCTLKFGLDGKQKVDVEINGHNVKLDVKTNIWGDKYDISWWRLVKYTLSILENNENTPIEWNKEVPTRVETIVKTYYTQMEESEIDPQLLGDSDAAAAVDFG